MCGWVWLVVWVGWVGGVGGVGWVGLGWVGLGWGGLGWGGWGGVGWAVVWGVATKRVKITPSRRVAQPGGDPKHTIFVGLTRKCRIWAIFWQYLSIFVNMSVFSVNFSYCIRAPDHLVLPRVWRGPSADRDSPPSHTTVCNALPWERSHKALLAPAPGHGPAAHMLLSQACLNIGRAWAGQSSLIYESFLVGWGVCRYVL